MNEDDVIFLKSGKTCSCGKTHYALPDNFRVGVDEAFAGYYWECRCGSTLYVTPDKVVRDDHGI